MRHSLVREGEGEAHTPTHRDTPRGIERREKREKEQDTGESKRKVVRKSG